MNHTFKKVDCSILVFIAVTDEIVINKCYVFTIDFFQFIKNVHGLTLSIFFPQIF